MSVWIAVPLGDNALALNGDERCGLAAGKGDGDAGAAGDGFEGSAVGQGEFGGDAEGTDLGAAGAADGAASGVEVISRGSVSDVRRVANRADGVRGTGQGAMAGWTGPAPGRAGVKAFEDEIGEGVDEAGRDGAGAWVGDEERWSGIDDRGCRRPG